VETIARARGIWLVGMSGTGKSTVASLAAARLGWPVIDLDAVIEERSGMRVPAIFEREGERGFRERESEALRAVASAGPAVVATGGGAPLRDENRALMERTGWVIALEARPETLHARIEAQLAREAAGAVRPLLGAGDPLERLRALKAARQPVYALAHWTIHTDRLAPEQVAAEVVRAREILERSADP
jgi:shikimate kinase